MDLAPINPTDEKGQTFKEQPSYEQTPSWAPFLKDLKPNDNIYQEWSPGVLPMPGDKTEGLIQKVQAGFGWGTTVEEPTRLEGFAKPLVGRNPALVGETQGLIRNMEQEREATLEWTSPGQTGQEDQIQPTAPPQLPDMFEKLEPPEMKLGGPKEENKTSTLSPIHNAFLGILNTAEQAGLGGSTLKLYNDVIQRGRTEPITEKDFKPDELASFKQLVEAVAAKTGKKEGQVDYKDYMLVPESSRPTTNILGGFQYKIDEQGHITISDKYDFNKNREGPLEDSMGVQLLAGLVNPRGLAASIGRRVKSDTGGEGVPVNLTIPSDFEAPQKTELKLKSQGMPGPKEIMKMAEGTVNLTVEMAKHIADDVQKVVASGGADTGAVVRTILTGMFGGMTRAVGGVMNELGATASRVIQRTDAQKLLNEMLVKGKSNEEIATALNERFAPLLDEASQITKGQVAGLRTRGELGVAGGRPPRIIQGGGENVGIVKLPDQMRYDLELASQKGELPEVGKLLNDLDEMMPRMNPLSKDYKDANEMYQKLIAREEKLHETGATYEVKPIEEKLKQLGVHEDEPLYKLFRTSQDRIDAARDTLLTSRNMTPKRKASLEAEIEKHQKDINTYLEVASESKSAQAFQKGQAEETDRLRQAFNKEVDTMIRSDFKVIEGDREFRRSLGRERKQAAEELRAGKQGGEGEDLVAARTVYHKELNRAMDWHTRLIKLARDDKNAGRQTAMEYVNHLKGFVESSIERAAAARAKIKSLEK